MKDDSQSRFRVYLGFMVVIGTGCPARTADLDADLAWLRQGRSGRMVAHCRRRAAPAVAASRPRSVPRRPPSAAGGKARGPPPGAPGSPSRGCGPIQASAAGPSRMAGERHAYDRTGPLSRIGTAQNPFSWWWQVSGSNQRRLSRRFYRPLLPALPQGSDLHK
jgi:hypothetical protein